MIERSDLEESTVLCALLTTSGRILSHWCHRRWQQDTSLPQYSLSSLALLVASVYALGKPESSGRMDCWPCWKVVYVANQPANVMVLLAVPRDDGSESLLDWMEFKSHILMSEVLSRFASILPELLNQEQAKLHHMAHSYTLGNALDDTNALRDQELQSRGDAMLQASVVLEILKFSFEMLTEQLKGTIHECKAYMRPMIEMGKLSEPRISRIVLSHTRRKRSVYDYIESDGAPDSSIWSTCYVSELIQAGANALDKLCRHSSAPKFMLLSIGRHPASSMECFHIAMRVSKDAGPFAGVVCFSDSVVIESVDVNAPSISRCPKLSKFIENAHKQTGGYTLSLRNEHVPPLVQKLLSHLLDAHNSATKLTLDDIEIQDEPKLECPRSPERA